MRTRTLVWLVFIDFVLLLKEKSSFEILTNCRDCWCVKRSYSVGYKTVCFHKVKHPANESILHYFHKDESIQNYYPRYKYKQNYVSILDYSNEPILNAMPHLVIAEYSSMPVSIGTLNIDCNHFSLADMSKLNTTVYDLMSQYNFSTKALNLTLNGCPFPDESFQPLFRILNITSVNALNVIGSPSNFSLSPVYFDNHFLSVVSITFKENIGLKGLHGDVFKGTPQLKTLELQRNNITTLGPGVFQNLKKLENLDLSYNSITDLDPDIFKNLTSLSTLRITNNLLVSLPRGLFQNCHELKELNLNENKLNNLKETPFVFLSKLTTLFLSGNGLEKITDGMFNGTHGLMELDLSRNKLSAISQPEFHILCKENSRYLRIINLSNNILEWNSSDFVDNPFHNCQFLNSLLLSNNRISYIHHDWIMGMPYLYNLDLGRNNITTLRDYNFTSFSKYLYLDVSNNQIKTVEINSIIYVKSDYFRIVLDENPIRCDCSNYGLFYFVQNSNKALGYQKVYIITRNLTCKPWNKSIDKVDLKTLTCSNVDGCPSLCNCSYSPYYNRTTVDCCSVNLKRMPQDLNVTYKSRTPGEIRLILRNNSIQQFLQNPSDNYKLVTDLDLSLNVIKDWRVDTVQHFPHLEKINLSHNHLELLSEDFINSSFYSNISSLFLDVSNNHIKTVELNYITYVDADVLLRKEKQNKKWAGPFDGIKLLLYENPITCDCSNYGLFYFIQNSHKAHGSKNLYIETRNIICKPLNKSIEEVGLKTLTCSNVDGCPSLCNCSYSTYYNRTTIDCCSVNLERMPQDLNVTYKSRTPGKIKLILRNNSIQQFLQNPSYHYKLVTELDLSLNAIKDWKVDTVQHFPHLEKLNLSHNHLESLSEEFINSSSFSNISSLSLSGNPWTCGCDNTPDRLYKFVVANEHILKDLKQITCNGSNQPLNKWNPKDFCSTSTIIQPSNQHLIVVTIILGCLGILFGLLVIIYYKYHHQIKVWLFAHGCLPLIWWVSEEDIDRDKLYDAFVSYAEGDYGFVVHTLLPELEKSFRICHHERDFIGGEWIVDQIHQKVHQSRRTIIVLTENFLNSVYGIYEFRTAHAQSIADNRARVIIIILGDMPPQEAMPEEMKAYMSMNTYLEWGSRWFWDKLKYALPHPPPRPIHECPLVERRS